MAEFGVETRWTVACTSRDMTVGETRLRRQIETMLLQGAGKQLESANKRFCSVPLTSCTPPVTTIPSFPPSIFWRHSPAARISLCLLPCLSPSRPSGSILQTTRFQRPCDILHPSSRCHPLFPDLQLLASLAFASTPSCGS